jgi:arylsulfatase A-like enzyme
LIEPGRPTLARLLQARGYRTAAIGKWHLGYGDRTPLDYTGILSPGPLTVGFDYHFGVPQNNGDRTGIYVENDRVRGLRSSTLTPTGRPTHYGPDYLGLDAPAREEAEVMTELGDRAVRWIADVPVGTPFFAYLTPTAVHEPIWPARATSGTSTAGPFGDFIHDLDRFVGRVLEALEKKGVLDQTLVLFSSDNGGVVLPSGGGRNDAIFRAQQAGLRMNGPWRGRKHSVYEGGFRVPLLARWPGHVPAGSEPTTMVNLVDVFATVAELVGAPLSGAAPGGEDSVSFLPQLLGRTTAPSRQAMVVHSAKGNFAVRDGEWKYIEGRPHPKVPAKALAPMAAEYQPQLYRLRTDPGEQHNVLAQYPAEARRLAALLETQRRQSSSRGVAAAPRP